MRLSEAIMLGAATCKLEPRNINSCAYGCALNALGVPQVADGTLDNTPRYDAITEHWPWTAEGEWWYVPAGKVMQKFDYEVCEGKITLEQLVDYVRSIEPNCDCCRFDCNCAQEAQQDLGVSHVTNANATTHSR